MSLLGNAGVGIPTVLFHESEGLVVTVETRTGHLYRGMVVSAEDSMNLSLRDVTATDPDGNKTTITRLFLRGSQVLFVIFPDILKEAPVFARLAKASKGISVAGGLGRGRKQAITAKGKLFYESDDGSRWKWSTPYIWCINVCWGGVRVWTCSLQPHGAGMAPAKTGDRPVLRRCCRADKGP